MSDSNDKSFDRDRQYSLTKEVWKTLRDRGVSFGKKHCLDLQFVSGPEASDKAGFSAALQDAGFQVDFYENDPTIEASTPDIVLTLETIWRPEKKGTKIALQFGYRPDGWGFMHDPNASD